MTMQVDARETRRRELGVFRRDALKARISELCPAYPIDQVDHGHTALDTLWPQTKT